MDLTARRNALLLEHADLVTRHQQATQHVEAAKAALAQVETDLAIVVGRRMEIDGLLADQAKPEAPPPLVVVPSPTPGPPPPFEDAL